MFENQVVLELLLGYGIAYVNKPSNYDLENELNSQASGECNSITVRIIRKCRFCSGNNAAVEAYLSLGALAGAFCPFTPLALIDPSN